MRENIVDGEKVYAYTGEYRAPCKGEYFTSIKVGVLLCADFSYHIECTRYIYAEVVN